MPDGRVHRPALRRLHARARDRRRRPAHGRVPRRRSVRDHDRAGDLRRARRSRSSSPFALVPRRPRAPARRAGPRTRRCARSLRALSRPRRRRSATGVRTAIDLVRERDARRCWARSPGGPSTSRCCGRASTRSATSAADRRDRHVATSSGMLGNLLPLPGGIGGVDGGMIGAFAAFGVAFGLATVAVLAYRAFAFWLPTIPGAIAYFQLRRTVARWREERARGATGPGRPARRPDRCATILCEVNRAKRSRTSSSSAAGRPATRRRSTRRAPTSSRSSSRASPGAACSSRRPTSRTTRASPRAIMGPEMMQQLPRPGRALRRALR